MRSVFGEKNFWSGFTITSLTSVVRSPTEEKNDALSTTTQDMKLAIVALGLGKDSLIMVNCAANLVMQDPGVVLRPLLVPDPHRVSLTLAEGRGPNVYFTPLFLQGYVLVLCQ